MPVELKNVSYQVKDKQILKNINTQFKEKGLHLIIGPNGSGKSTLLKLIYQMIKPSEGELFFQDCAIKDFAYLGQYNHIFHNINLEYFLCLNRYIKTGEVKRDAYVEEIIELFSLEKLLKQSLSSMSGGERQRSILASVFLLEKDYVLLDEPFSYLDIASKLEIASLIENTFKDKTILLVSHNFTIFNQVKKTVAMKEGSIFLDKKNLTVSELEELFDIVGSAYFIR